MSDMTEIDVPDWVVKAAEDARVHRLNAVTAYGSAGVDERYHMAMRAALTAALGAWVVHEGFFDPDAMDHLRSNVIDPVGVLRRKSNGISTVAIYTLRQEKPE